MLTNVRVGERGREGKREMEKRQLLAGVVVHSLRSADKNVLSAPCPFAIGLIPPYLTKCERKFI